MKAKQSKPVFVPTKKESFLDFLKEKEQRNRLLIIAAFYIVAYFILTYLYPFPDGISDSGGYLLSAAKNQYYGYRPFGYSKFMIFLHGISESISFVVTAQYFLNALSTILFLFTIKYILRPTNRLFSVLFDVFSICSISVLYLCNSILSDSVFASLTLLWIICGIWIVYSSKVWLKFALIATQILLLYYLITIRYTGLLYIGVELGFIFFLFFRHKLSYATVSAVLLLLISLKIYSGLEKETEALTGIKVVSGFAGWQKANNALHVMPYIDLDVNKIENTDLREFAKLAKDSAALLKLDSYKASAGFLWDNKKPLKLYLVKYANEKQLSYLPAWTALGKDTYDKFGSYIMVHYPIQYLRYYLIPNLLGTLYPTADQLYAKEFKTDAMPTDLLESWYGVDTKKDVYARSSIIHDIAAFFPVYRVLLWVILFISIVFFFVKKQGKHLSDKLLKIYWLLLSFVAVYFAFHVYAAPFELRYIAPIHVLQIAIIYLSFHHQINKAQEDTNKNK